VLNTQNDHVRHCLWLNGDLEALPEIEISAPQILNSEVVGPWGSKRFLNDGIILLVVFSVWHKECSSRGSPFRTPNLSEEPFQTASGLRFYPPAQMPTADHLRHHVTNHNPLALQRFASKAFPVTLRPGASISSNSLPCQRTVEATSWVFSDTDRNVLEGYCA
jgi:hypothetical protein